MDAEFDELFEGGEPEGEEPEGGQEPEGEEPEGGQPDPVAELRRELAELRQANAELTGRVAGLQDGGRRTQRRAAEPDEDEPEADDDETAEVSPDELIEELTKGGLPALAKRGVVMKRDLKQTVTQIAHKVAQQIVAGERQKLAQDAELLRQFPELQDNESELFRTTQRIFRENAEADPVLAKSPRALLLAAREAKREMAERETARQSKVRAQSGVRSQGRGGAAYDGDDDELSIGPETRTVMSLMQVSEKEFRSSAKSMGVGRGGKR